MEENPLLNFDDEEEAAQLAAFKQRKQVDEIDLSIFEAEMEASAEESRHYFYEVETPDIPAPETHEEEDEDDPYGHLINQLEEENETPEADTYDDLIAQLEEETYQPPAAEEELEELSEDYTGGSWAPHPLALSEDPWEEETEEPTELETEPEGTSKPLNLKKAINLTKEPQEAAQEEAKRRLNLRKRINPNKDPEGAPSKPKGENPLAAKAKGVFADFKEQVKSLRADDTPPKKAKGTMLPEPESPGKGLALAEEGGATAVTPAAADGPNKLLSLLLTPWRWWVGVVDKLLALLSRVPLLGRPFKPLGKGKLLKVVAILLPLLLLGLLMPKALQVPLASSPAYTKSLPDEGGFTVSQVTYDPAKGVVTAQVANTGAVIVNTTPTFTVTGVQQGFLPKTWYERKPLTTCTSKPLQLQIDQKTTITVACKPLKGKAFSVETKTEEN